MPTKPARVFVFSDFVRSIFTDEAFLSALRNELGTGGAVEAFTFANTAGHFKSTKVPPFVDALLVPVVDPARTIALRLACVPFSPSRYFSDQSVPVPTLFGESASVNSLYNLGFHKTVFMMCLVVDGADKYARDPGAQHLVKDTIAAIRWFPERQSVHPEVGIAFVNVITTEEGGKQCPVQTSIQLDVPAKATHQAAECTAFAMSLAGTMADCTTPNRATVELLRA